jgi:hypothetical protein
MYLISFVNCGRTVRDQSAAGISPLGVFDIEDGSVSWLQLPDIAASRGGVTGLAASDDFLFCLCQGAHDSLLLVYSKPGLRLHDAAVLPVADPHDALFWDGYLYTVASDQDSIVRFRVDRGVVDATSPQLFWKPPGASGTADTHHINSLAVLNEELLVSAFGAREGATWSTAGEGYVWNVSRQELVIDEIFQPHSLVPADGQLLFCESPRSAVRRVGGQTLRLSEGYTRGLCPSSGHLLVGLSAGRNVSKSTGLVNNPADPGGITAGARLALLATGDLRGQPTSVQAWYELGDFHHEIYDIEAIDDVLLDEDCLAGWNRLERLVHDGPRIISGEQPGELRSRKLQLQQETEALYRQSIVNAGP